MGAHIRNSHNHRHNPHMHAIRASANHQRSDTINSMQAVDNAGIDGAVRLSNLAQPLSKDRCASAESSTCSAALRAELNILEPRTALNIKPTNHSSAFISDYHSLNPTLKKSGTRSNGINDTGTHPTGSNYGDGHCGGGSNKELICANEAAKLIPAGNFHADDHAVASCGINGHVCCMCGDSGIAELLFACSKCAHRHQHIYCSRSYPNMGDETSICNWCLHEEDSIASTVTKASDTVLANINAADASAIPAAGRAKCHGLRDQVLEENDQVMVKKGHSKAFEYLLLVAAAQSLRPQDNRAISGNVAEIKQENHIVPCTTNSTRASDRALGKVIKDPEIIQPINVTPLANIVNNVGPHTEIKSNRSPHNISKLSVSLGTHQSMRIQNPMKISIDHKNIDVGRLIGGSIPKRQRCNKGINTSLKCRKKGLQLSPSRPNYRRYKLLADVVC